MPTCFMHPITFSIIGTSKGLRNALEVCRKAAKEKDPVLFQGEVGTGKLLLATYLHDEGAQPDKTLYIVDCAQPHGIIQKLLSEDFNINYFEFLNGGSLYFREVASLSLEDQKRLYHFCLRIEPLKIRIFLSSSQNIHFLMLDKAFDQNLYRYVGQWEISIPPLRQRKEDIPLLIEHLIKNLNLRLRKSVQGLTPQAEQILTSYRWPGNIEELEQVLTRAIILGNEPYISQRHLRGYLLSSDYENTINDVMPLDRMEEILLKSALERYGYTLEGKKRAARALNISLATLYNKVKRYNLNE